MAGCLENPDDNDTSAKNMAAGAASGVCYSGEGCCRASGSLAGRSKHIPAHTGGEKMKNHGRALCSCRGVWELLFLWKRDFRYGFWRKEDYIHKLCGIGM